MWSFRPYRQRAGASPTGRPGRKLRFPASSFARKPSKSGSNPKSGNNSATKRCLQSLPSRPHQILTPLRLYTLPHLSPPFRHQPSSPSRRRCHRPAGLCRHRFFSHPHHLFNVFLEVRHVRKSHNFAIAKQRWRTSIRIYSIDT